MFSLIVDHFCKNGMTCDQSKHVKISLLSHHDSVLLIGSQEESSIYIAIGSVAIHIYLEMNEQNLG